MVHPHSYDIVIIGGGLAGLSLAAELSDDRFSSLSIVILEPREEYKRDKTWSYWRKYPHEFSLHEAATWPAWRLTAEQKNVVVCQSLAEGYCYASISSDAFYQAAFSKINACKHIHILQNERVESLRAEAGFAIIALKSAKNIVAKQAVFDSRPILNPKTNVNKTHLNQHFLGLEVSSDFDLFDANCIDLMDFKQSNHGIHFMYVLPYTKSRALIESTWICPHSHHGDYTQELDDYLNKRWPEANFKIEYSESACLPLVNQSAREYLLGDVQVIPIGSAAGTARAATGYAFLETLADSKRLANLLISKKRLTAFRRNTIDKIMDTLFLSFLAENASYGSTYFMQMFTNCKPVSLIRFLTGQASWRDRLNVVISVPTAPMVKHLLRIKQN